MVGVDIEVERAALEAARFAAHRKVEKLSQLTALGADALSEEYVNAVLAGAIEKLQHELTVFGRIDDDEVWRIGIYGVESGGSQLVVDWRAPFARAFYQAGPHDHFGLRQRASYVGSIDEIFVENFETGDISGSSPLIHELARSRGDTMRAAVATLQSEQDDLVRRPPDSATVIRGGPGTGKTVVGLHRAAWLVYNHSSIVGAENMLVLGPSDRYIRYVASVLPSLGEGRIRHSTVERLLGPTSRAGATIDWPSVLDRFEERLYQPGEVKIGRRRITAEEVATILHKVGRSNRPWRDKRKGVESSFARATGRQPADVRAAVAEVMPPCSAKQAMRKLRQRTVLKSLDVADDQIDAWLDSEQDGPLMDELSARFEKAAPKYAHVIVDEAQDLTAMQLRAVRRRATGFTFVGDDAQRSVPAAIGLSSVADDVGAAIEEMRVAYRMSSEIASWLNDHARRHGINAVELEGIRPTGTEVGRASRANVASELVRLRSRHETVELIDKSAVWTHKGVEYDAVAVDTEQMTPAEIYLAASRAAHELVVIA